MNLLNDDELPIGFGMALAKDSKAMNAFSALNKSEKDSIIEKSKQIKSKREMEQFTSSLYQNTTNTNTINKYF